MLDFYCHDAQLAVELDGAVHDDPARAAYDARRTSFLNDREVRVLRFSNDEVLEQVDIVAEAIEREAGKAPHPVPLPGGEGTS